MITIQNIEKALGTCVTLPYYPNMAYKPVYDANITLKGIHPTVDHPEYYTILLEVDYTNYNDMSVMAKIHRERLTVSMGKYGNGWAIQFDMDKKHLASPTALMNYLFRRWESYRRVDLPFTRTT